MLQLSTVEDPISIMVATESELRIAEIAPPPSFDAQLWKNDCVTITLQPEDDTAPPVASALQFVKLDSFTLNLPDIAAIAPPSESELH